MRQIKIIVERHSDGYVAYPIGLKGVVVGEGNSYEEALADVKSPIEFHIETFGMEVSDRHHKLKSHNASFGSTEIPLRNRAIVRS